MTTIQFANFKNHEIPTPYFGMIERRKRMNMKIVGWIFLFFMFTMNAYADSTDQDKSEFSIGNNRFKILKVYLGSGLKSGGMVFTPNGMTDDQTCLILELKEISGNIASMIKLVTDEKKVKFENVACTSKNKILTCMFAVNKSSKSFTLHLSKEKTINLSHFMK